MIDTSKENLEKSMEKLSISPPNIGARTSDYVLETIKFIEKVFENGYAYESNSSVYFDSLKFRQQHSYEKSQPEQIAAVALSIEGENTSEGKKNECDFIVCKRRSEPDEPV
jgi:cysteinyl-tRNA synthetase